MQLQKFDPAQSPIVFTPASETHKGENGRLLVIGGSELFHAAPFWSADVASKIVDLVHFSSPTNENNDLVRQKNKNGFWSGIVVEWTEIDAYIQEDEVVLIGPGMARGEETAAITNALLKKYPDKKWVIDGGALQEVLPSNLSENCIITPHEREWQRLIRKIDNSQNYFIDNWNDVQERSLKTQDFSKAFNGVTILTKASSDIVSQIYQSICIDGGHPGMTKGGTGDVLAGLVAALYCKNDPWVSVQIASYVNKQAGETLAKKVGPFFNAGDLVQQVPKELYKLVKSKL